MREVLTFWGLCVVAGGFAAGSVVIGWGHVWPTIAAFLLMFAAGLAVLIASEQWTGGRIR